MNLTSGLVSFPYFIPSKIGVLTNMIRKKAGGNKNVQICLDKYLKSQCGPKFRI